MASKNTLDINGADGFSLKLPKVSSMVEVSAKEHEKENIPTKAASVYLKRFKFSTVPSTSPQVDNEASSRHVNMVQNILIRKAMMILITRTPNLFANVSNNFERMSTQQVLIRVEIEKGGAHIMCPYCLKSSAVALSYSEGSNKPWWNTSNFDSHVQRIHKDLPNFDADIDSADILEPNFRIAVSRQPIENDINSTLNPISEMEEYTTKPLGLMLQNFMNAAVRNMDRKKELTKMFVSDFFMLSGPNAYEALNANLPLSIPSISIVHRFITDKDPRFIEGEMCTDELLQYLNNRNLPLKISLSEDATRITAKVLYDPTTNQLIGYALPLDKNGKFSFLARSATEIQTHFLNTSIVVSSTAYDQMAQPFEENSSPFCLMIILIDNTFTADNVLKRWRFQASKLKEKGITINNFSTDGDSKPLLAMKILSKIGQTDKSYFDCEWFSCGGYVETTFMQDTIHIIAKLRNRLLECSRIYPIGFNIVSKSHLQYLIENVSEDKHLLTSYDIEPKDRQNYLSAEKICSENTIKCLIDYVPGSEATVVYLKAMRGVLSAVLDGNLQSAERIYQIWSAVFLFRAWCSWLLNSEKINPSYKKSKNFYTLKDNFISSSCYTCIELNAHTLVKKILFEDSVAGNSSSENKEVFFSDLYGSQPCENMFRQVRSFTSTFSTVVNFSTLDITHRINKIQLQNYTISQSNDQIKVIQKLNRAAITSEIENAKKDVISDLEKLGLDTSKLNFRCQIKPVFEQNILEFDRDLDDSDSDEVDSMFNGNDGLQSDNFENQEEVLQQGDYLSGITGELMLKDYREIESRKNSSIDQNSPFVVVVDGKGIEKVVRKSSVWWLKDKHKFSSDRLVRVMEKDYSVKFPENNELLTADKYVVQKQITVGEWCIFFENNGDDERTNILIGMVLGFTYLVGTTFKAREFSKVSATVLPDPVSDSRDVGVICAFYTFNADGKLTSDDKHKFINIKSYVGTIQPPVYVKNLLTISEKLVEEIERTF